jgi:hypothetical protein
MAPEDMPIVVCMNARNANCAVASGPSPDVYILLVIVKITKRTVVYGHILPVARLISVTKFYQLYHLRTIDTSKEHTDGLHQLWLLRKELSRSGSFSRISKR